MIDLIKIKRSDGSMQSVTQGELDAINEVKRLKKQLFFIDIRVRRWRLFALISWLFFIIYLLASWEQVFRPQDPSKSVQQDRPVHDEQPLVTTEIDESVRISDNAAEMERQDFTPDSVEEEFVAQNEVPMPESRHAPNRVEKSQQPASLDGYHFDERDIILTLQAWARAWSARDYETYINAYTATYSPVDNITHPEWVRQRQSRLESSNWINVKVYDFNIVPPDESGVVIVRFKQDYLSNTYMDLTLKEISLRYLDGKWLIFYETTIRKLDRKKSL